MNSPSADTSNLQFLAELPAQQLHDVLLQGVSRTFALTIPQLPQQLYLVVANAYLLCRIVDTIEDEVSLSPSQKTHFCTLFIGVVRGGEGAGEFAKTLSTLLSKQTIPAEHNLIKLTPQVIAVTNSFAPAQRQALASCVSTMANGMPTFQAQNLSGGLAKMTDMDRYCYVVAGCVGEMLAKLFCHYSPACAKNSQQLAVLAVSFGQGLQMTNILKDIWDDAERGVCWLPQDVFAKFDFDLQQLSTDNHGDNFQQGLLELTNIAREHLHNALKYTQLLPRGETGMRNFCLQALGMAVLTLNKISQNTNFTNAEQVKISRRQVRQTVLTGKLFARSNYSLSLLFSLYCRRPKQSPTQPN